MRNLHILGLLCLFALVANLSLSSLSRADELPTLIPGTQAPDFTVNDFDGQSFHLADQKGKIVVLEWIYTKCPFVLRAYQQGIVAEIFEKYKDKNLVWRAVNSTSFAGTEENQEWKMVHDLQYPILDDREGVVGKLFGAKSTPHFFIIDGSGKIAYNGALDDDPYGDRGAERVPYVADALEALVSGKPVPNALNKSYGCGVKY